MIQVHNLYKRFGSVAAVDGLSFDVPDGAITGLLGANGAGKSTTLRMICGIVKPDGGEIAIQGERGALLDQHGLYPRLTARENLRYFARLHAAESREPASQGTAAHGSAESRVEEVIAELGLASIADRRAAGFSQGERMKVALGRAMIHAGKRRGPQNLILDEPTNGLDVPSVRMLRAVLQRMRAAGHAVLFSSHVLDEVRTICDKVVIVSRGRLVAQGTPAEVCRQSGCESLEDAFVRLTEEALCAVQS